MESVESNTSDGGDSVVSSGVVSSSSGVMSSSLSLETKHQNTRVSRLISKLQILSPISDKSQEHSSSPSDSRSPHEDSPDQEPGARKHSRKNLHLNFQDSDQSGSSLGFKTLRTPDIQQYLNVPWDIPKLKAKLKNRRNCFRGQSSSPETSPKKVVLKKSPDVEVILQSDCSKQDSRMKMKFDDYSAVKCSQSSTTVKTPELEKFLEVPWEVPKLRKKIAHRKKLKTLVNIQGSDSGISMSSQETKDILVGSSWTGSASSFKHKSQVYLSSVDARSGAEDDDCVSFNSNNESSLEATREFHFEFRRPSRDIPSSAVDYSSNNETSDAPENVVSNERDSDVTGDNNMVANNSDKHDLSQASQENIPVEQDLSDLPFAMPKLQRRLRESGRRTESNRLSLAILPSQGVEARSKLNLSFNNNVPQTKQSRPLSLLASNQLQLSSDDFHRNPSPAPASLTHKSFKRKPLLFLTTPSINLAQSVSIDTSLPLENQEYVSV